MDKFDFFKGKDKKDFDNCFIICSKKALCELLCGKYDDKDDCHDKKDYDDCRDKWDDDKWNDKDCDKKDKPCDKHDKYECNKKECCEKKYCEKDKYFDKF